MNRAHPLRRRVRGLAVLAVPALAAVLLVPAAAGPARADAGEGRSGTNSTVSTLSTVSAAKQADEPLSVRLTSLSPSTVPRSGPLRLSGTVTNSSRETWRDINVHAFVSRTPITTASALAQAAATPYDADVGSRLQTAHAFVGVGDLAPGRSTTFALRVPRAELPIPEEPGVYWVGVHALGADKLGRDGVADGRARTFIPLVRARKVQASLALVLPFRDTVRRDATGQLRNPDRWAGLAAPDGRMGRLLRLGESAGAAPLTLAVDPAVLDAVGTVGNGPTDPGDPGPVRTTGSKPATGASSTGSRETRRAKPPTGAEAATARDWLSRFTALAQRDRVLGLGYADPDVAALSRSALSLLDKADALSARSFQTDRIDADPAVVPANGHLPATALAGLGSRTVVLLDDTAAPGRRTRWRTSSGQPLVVTDAQAAEGGPGPTPATTALAMRQRLVSEAALRALSGSSAPLVVALPSGWDPGPDWQRADFFGGLDLPWLRLAGLDTTSDAPVVPRVVYPPALAANEIGDPQVSAAEDVIAAAGTYADALIASPGVVTGYTRQALEGTSYHARADPASSRAQSLGLARSIRSRLDGIRVVGSSFVRMSGGSGSFVVTLVNGLDRPVRVGLQARTSSGELTITTPRTMVLQPRQRTTARLHAHATDIGVREVRLTPVTSKGEAVGTSITFSVRTSQVTTLIWGVMAGGAILLVAMIVRRALKRGGLRRETPQP